MGLDDGIVIITALSDLMRGLAIGCAILVIGVAATGLYMADQDDERAGRDRVDGLVDRGIRGDSHDPTGS